MLREKLTSTLIFTAVIVAATMVVDFVVTVLILRNPAGYTPLVTFAISTIIAAPVTYGFVNGRTNLRIARDALAEALAAAQTARIDAQHALKQAEDAHAKAERDRAAAIEASRAKSEFLANMSHELRTPLNAILGFSEALSSGVFAAKREEYSKLIHMSGTHLLGLVNDLLDLSRIEANKVELHDEEIDISALFDECASIVDPGIKRKNLFLQLCIEPGLPLAIADRRALRQVLLNLLANAIKFSSRNADIALFARLDSDGGMTLGVEDEGIGIADDEQARMFERFGQGRHDVVFAHKGTGLGLPIVKGLTEAHGGRVAMTSRLGEGTTVTIRLPPERVIGRLRAGAA